MKFEYLYHGTINSALLNIAQVGLTPSKGHLGCRAAVFFATRLRTAEWFASLRCFLKGGPNASLSKVKFTFKRQGYPVLLRVRADVLTGGGRLKKDFRFFGGLEFFNWMFFGTVPPENIEVLVMGEWKPLLAVV